MTTLHFAASLTTTSIFSEASTTNLVSTTYASTANTSFSTTSHPNCTIDNMSIRVPLAIFYSLFFVFGLVGNIFALWVFLFLHSNRNSVRVFLINCAIADLVLLACLPFRVFYHANGDKWVLGSVTCNLVGNVFYMNMYMSIVLLGFISLDRYLRLSGKGRSQRGMRLRLLGRRQLWSWVACGILWTFFLTMMLINISTPGDKNFNGKCFHYRLKMNWKAYLNYLLVLLFWLIFIIIVVSYAKIASLLFHVSKNKPDFPNANKYQQTAKKSFFVLFVFMICFVPYHTFRPFYIFTQLGYFKSCAQLQMVDHTNEIMLLISVMNSCLDPVMFFLLSGSVRKMALNVVGQRLGTRIAVFNEATWNSSTMENRGSSTPLPEHVLINNPSLTTRSSFCAVNSNHCHTGVTLLPSAGQQKLN